MFFDAPFSSRDQSVINEVQHSVNLISYGSLPNDSSDNTEYTIIGGTEHLYAYDHELATQVKYDLLNDSGREEWLEIINKGNARNFEFSAVQNDPNFRLFKFSIDTFFPVNLDDTKWDFIYQASFVKNATGKVVQNVSYIPTGEYDTPDDHHMQLEINSVGAMDGTVFDSNSSANYLVTLTNVKTDLFTTGTPPNSIGVSFGTDPRNIVSFDIPEGPGLNSFNGMLWYIDGEKAYQTSPIVNITIDNYYVRNFYAPMFLEPNGSTPANHTLKTIRFTDRNIPFFAKGVWSNLQYVYPGESEKLEIHIPEHANVDEWKQAIIDSFAGAPDPSVLFAHVNFIVDGQN